MTRHLLRIQAALREQLLARGLPLQRPLPPAARDGYAALWQWDQSGRQIHRLTPEQAAAARRGLPEDTRLDKDECRGAVAYQLLERDQWFVLARIEAREPVTLKDAVAIGYSEPMLVYITEAESAWATGCINLRDCPTPGRLEIAPGKFYRELYSQPLEREDLRAELIRLAMVLPHFYFL